MTAIAIIATWCSLIIPAALVTGTAGASTTSATIDLGYGRLRPVHPDFFHSHPRSSIGNAYGTIAAGQTVTVPTAGVGSIPSAEFTAVFVNIEVISSMGTGDLTDYASDQPAPVGASVSFYSGLATSGSDVLSVGGQFDASRGRTASDQNEEQADVLRLADVGTDYVGYQCREYDPAVRPFV